MPTFNPEAVGTRGRWLLALGACSLLACNGVADSSTKPALERARSPGSTTPVAPAPEPSHGAEVEAVRAWVLAAPGRASATVELVEPSRSPSDTGTFRVVARDGEPALDAWVPADSYRSADAYWLVAELVSLVRREGIDGLVRAHGWTFWTIAGHTMMCREPSGACYSFPEQLRVTLFFCHPRGDQCILLADNNGRIEEWRIDATTRGVHRRRVRSWPAVVEPLDGRWDAGARSERSPRERMPEVARPPFADDPALEKRGGVDVEDDPNELGEDPCTPTIRSFRHGDLVVRSVGCGEIQPGSITEWPVAFVVTRAGRTEATPLFIPSPGPPSPERPFDVSVLAGDDAVGFIADASDGGGFSSEDLWVLVPGDGSRPLRLHSLHVSSWSTLGLGTEDEREGYVVGIDRSRSTLEVSGPGAARFVRCQRWSGTHARRSDRWEGERWEAPLDVPVTFDRNRGFVISEQDRERYQALCGPQSRPPGEL